MPHNKTETQPFSASLSWMLENPIARVHARRIMRHLEISPGMRVLDVGCGSGRLALPIAEIVGDGGEVVGLDLQERMVERLQRRAGTRGLGNVTSVHAPAGEGRLPEGPYDLALLIAVLGEIPEDRRALAVEEIARSLKPGGVLAVAEGPPDPHRQSKETVIALGSAADLEPMHEDRVWGGFVLQLRKASSLKL
jgi:ubiquinone/menaquinone biosynthesis C-methylase UbiE